jgi:thiamine pyrophosphate-dependent acetolactate synthase large subunit-like protein
VSITGNQLVGRALREAGVDTMFFIMGGPTNDAALAASAAGVRMIDVRHEQAAAMMAHAYARVKGRPTVCMGASGPGTINFTTGLANALVDSVPVVAFGGASSVGTFGTGAFQEVDQLEIMRPVTKWAERVYDTHRIPEYIDRAFAMATSGRPGPVYLDLPGDVLYGAADETKIEWPRKRRQSKPCMDAATLAECVALLEKSQRPLILAGSGVIWSDAAVELRSLVESAGIPFYTTPQGRGSVPEDHDSFFGNARSTAFKEADLVFVVGTRLNYVFGQGRSPRFSASATFVMINIDAEEIARSPRVDLGIQGDAGAVLAQLSAAARNKVAPDNFAEWRARLSGIEKKKLPEQEATLNVDTVPIHPLRLCKELRDFMDRDTILAVDGQEILNYARRAIPTFNKGHRLNSGTFGTMGVGLPFGLGAKAASPDSKVIVLHGDGSFGLNGMELDTAVRHKLPLLVVISLNGGWTADPEKKKPGRDLGYTRFDKLAEALECYSEYVERPEDIRPALDRAAAEVAKGRVALVNVVTDWRARADTVAFASYST